MLREFPRRAKAVSGRAWLCCHVRLFLTGDRRAEEVTLDEVERILV
jgi:hypothetical protein